MKKLFAFLILLSSFSGYTQERDTRSPVASLYLYNFLSLIDYPDYGNNEPYYIMFPCEGEFSQAVKANFKSKFESKKLGSHELKVSESNDIGQIDKMTIVFVTNECRGMEQAVKVGIGNKPILFVGYQLNYDMPMINMIITDSNTLRFTMNSQYMKLNNLKPSEKLENLAIEQALSEKEWSSIVGEMEFKLAKNKKEKITISEDDLSALLDEYDTKMKEIEKLEEEFVKKKREVEYLEESIKSKSDKLSAKEEELLLKNAEMDSIKVALEKQKEKIQIKSEELVALGAKLEEQQKVFYKVNFEIEIQKKFIDSMNVVMQDLGDSILENVALINEQNQKIKVKDDELGFQKETINEQQKQLFISILFVIIIAIGGIITFRSYRQKKKANLILEEQRSRIEHQKREIENQHEEIMDSIAYAKRIQTAILPPTKLVKKYLDQSFILYKPKDIVAGDFYWMESQGKRILFAAADCTGHGVPGAMVSVICNNGLNRATREFGLSDPGEILNKTRELVIQEFEKSEEEVKDGMDIALCSLEGNNLKFTGANNPLWIIRNGSNELEEIKADKQPIGKYAEPKPFMTHEIELNSGDTFYIFSDGFADQFGGDKGKKFKAKNFKSLLLSIQNEYMHHQKELIDDAFEKWRGNLEQLDDICVIGVRV